MNNQAYSPWQFSFFRIIFGLYLVIHFFELIPYGADLFSNQGLIADVKLNFTYPAFPNILYVFDSPSMVTAFLIAQLCFALSFMIGFQRRLMAVLLWYGWACLFNRNVLISNPGLPFVGWTLFACAIIPPGEPLALATKRDEQWQFPKLLFYGAWVLMGFSYTVSGVHKCTSPSWVNGDALLHLITNPLARDTFLRDLLLAAPAILLQVGTWFVLALEVLFLPLCYFPLTRKISSILMILMHIGIMLVVDFADLTFGMLMFHFFLFDGRWIEGSTKEDEEKPIVFFDGVCGLCNSSIDMLFDIDKEGKILVSPLQGERASQLLGKIEEEDINSIVFYQKGTALKKSSAVIAILGHIGGVWGLVSVFLLIPRFIRDAAYDLVAKNRYSWFGKKETCRMPTPAERERFLP